MANIPPELQAHREWLGQIQQVGLVVSPQVLVNKGVFVDRQKSIDAQERLRELLSDDEDRRIDGFLAFTRDVLEWPEGFPAGAPGGPDLPETLTVALPEYDDALSPTYALPSPDGERAVVAGTDAAGSGSDVAGGLQPSRQWLALISIVLPGTDLDKPPADHSGWRASPHARLERLLRDTGVPVGLLFSGTSLRLIYAPRGESSGHLTFRFAHLAETLGRPMVGALCALLGVERVTDVGLEQQRLPSLLRESRKYQNEVSTALAGQVLEALWELLRGLQRANEESKGVLLADVLREQPGDVYGGLLTTMMRLVFILYAEDRGLMPASEVYQRHYSVSGLFERLREDQARYPDTMDARYGAWAQLLVLFRLIHDGGGHRDFRFPSRHGRLFDPDAYPFLEGRPHGSHRQAGESVDPPKVADGVVFRMLGNLLMLEGERLSYRALDVEQIGSVYEAMMGFALRVATGHAIAVTPKHIVFEIGELLERKGKERASWLKEQTELKVPSDAIATAKSVDDVVSALGKKVSRYTPHVLKAGDLFLQPTEERRRSGSHYTPRSLTEPIVRTTFRPILERLGDQATPEQILDLKVCDPAMGSGAFLVEACRLLGDRLVRAWEVHKATPKVPDDEEVVTHARRLVAEWCLYGVDKNIFAVDLAKLSLWLATLAKDHPFTFLDHALRHGDSLVGLSREQIACLHWLPGKQLPLVRSFLDARVAHAQELRIRIQGMGASDDVPEKARLLKEADEAIADVRLIGDVIVSVFFEREKPKEREALRVAYAGKIDAWLPAESYVAAGFSRPDLAAAVGAGFPGLACPEQAERVEVSDRNGLTRVEGSRPEAASAPSTALELRAIQQSIRTGERPVPAFHWEIEFPEVFTRENGGFDAFVGNPPFMGGRNVTQNLGERYNNFLCSVHEHASGGADLVAHFYRSAFNLLRKNGAFGLIATNTIAQGDTRGTGLRWIRHHGGTIFEARKRVKWPGAAAVIVSVVHVAKGAIPGPYLLDGRPVGRVTAFLFHAGVDDDPVRLKANADRSFIGSYVLGMGFTFDDTDNSGVANPISLMHDLVRKDPRNAERIFPYIGGEEVNDSPTHAHHRYVIDFEEMSEEEARAWPALFEILEHKVKPERVQKDAKKYPRMVNEWWKFWNHRSELHAAIRGLERVLVIPRVSQYHGPTFLEPTVVMSEQLVACALSDFGSFAVLQARPHEWWFRFFGSSLEERPRYTPSDCFETFPFPSAWESNPTLSDRGREYYDFRAALMVRSNEGLTKTYNRFHDPDEHDSNIVTLRELHDAMDRAVLHAYGWTDIRPACEFILDYEDEEDDTLGKASKRKKPWRYRWPDDIRDEVLGRLLELNARRAEEERLAGEEAKKAATPSRRRGRKAADTPLLD